MTGMRRYCNLAELCSWQQVHNNDPGFVVAPAEGTVVKLGRVAVLLEGAKTPISIKMIKLRI